MCAVFFGLKPYGRWDSSRPIGRSSLPSRLSVMRAEVSVAALVSKSRWPYREQPVAEPPQLPANHSDRPRRECVHAIGCDQITLRLSYFIAMPQVRPTIDCGMMSVPDKPLSALLSQILVAYSVEIDCEFERCMLQTQSRSARLSLVIWLNVLQFLTDGPVTVRTLASRALTAEAGAT